MSDKDKKSVKKAVFPVGGLGTRFLPATKVVPKEMLPVVDKPLIQYAFEEARSAGIEQFIFVTGRNKAAINNHFDHAYELQAVLSEDEKHDFLERTRDWVPEPGSIAFTRQQYPLGLGHAVYCARHFIGDEPFAVLLADEMFIDKRSPTQEMVDVYNNLGGNVLSVAEVSPENTHKYGIVDPDGVSDGDVVKVKGMVEKPAPEDAPSNLSITGRYILQPEVFAHLEKGKKGASDEIQLTDAIAAMAVDVDTYGVKFNGRRYDCGNRVGFLEANIAFALEHDDMRSGVQEMLKGFA